MKKLIFIIILGTAHVALNAQDLPPEITDQIEAYLEDQDEEIDGLYALRTIENIY